MLYSSVEDARLSQLMGVIYTLYIEKLAISEWPWT
jgi:hypothetical protein